MITKIKLKDVASYTELVEICNLRKINFFFGSNGTGKTTLSKLISKPDYFPSCSLECEGNKKLKTLVFNEDFVEEYFYQPDDLMGIFTMGGGAKENEEKIQQLNEEGNETKKNSLGLSKKLDELKENSEKIKNDFRDICWKRVYLKYQNDFPEIFKGYRNSKEKFAEEIIIQNKNSWSELKIYEELEERYKLLYEQDLEILDELKKNKRESIQTIKVTEKNNIYQTKIIGKQDLDISKMINKLQNHDWVKQGKTYYEKNFDESTKTFLCPFCQQKTSEKFKEKLEEYFDESYKEQINELNQVIRTYESQIEELEEYFSSILETLDNKYLEDKRASIQAIKEGIDDKIRLNKEFFADKKRNPSTKIKLQSIVGLLNQSNKILDKVNKNIKQHNKVVNNREKEEGVLKSNLWHFFCDEISDELKKYTRDSNGINKAIKNINKQFGENEKKLENKKTQISILERKIKSVKPTVNAINKLLDGFGFTGFRLDSTEDGKHYKIIRINGEPAKESLSEGERNLIVFLYFYHLIRGVIDPDENINEDKIIVFDDPVSSFDSGVLFLVSTLIKHLINPLRKNENTNIKQFFVLTHNVYFFKEITFFSSREQNNRRNDTMYFIVKKYEGISKIGNYETNPIKTTYQLLWDNIKKDDNNDLVSIQNNMRRIIEFYFKMLANIDEEDVLNKFSDLNNKLICKSLIAWLNMGSHEVFDDIDFDSSQGCDISRYRNVFKSIFEKTGHLAHYNMMMEINNSENV